jgi:hypothetical protein
MATSRFGWICSSHSSHTPKVPSRIRRGAGIAQLFGSAIDVRNCESTVGCALDFVHLIRTLLNRNAVPLTRPSLQVRDQCL